MPARCPANRRVPRRRGTAWPRQSFSGARLAPENHPEHKTDPERSHDRFGRIFAHILLGIVLESANASARISPSLFRLFAGVFPSVLGFATIFFGDGASRAPQILGSFARVCLAAFELVLCVPQTGRPVCFIIFSHCFSPFEFLPLLSARSRLSATVGANKSFLKKRKSRAGRVCFLAAARFSLRKMIRALVRS